MQLRRVGASFRFSPTTFSRATRRSTHMAEISAAMVKELREKTGAGMMDCKKALTESAGDFSKAEEWLRKKGVASAAKKGARVAAEGLVGLTDVAPTRRLGAIVEVNSETDFVARNADFVQPHRRAGQARRPAQPGRRRRAARAAARERQVGEGRGHREDRHHRREPHRAPLRPLPGRGQRRAGQLPALATTASRRWWRCWAATTPRRRRWPPSWRCSRPP